MGREGFRGKVLNRVANENLQSKEIPHRRAWEKTLAAEAIIQMTCSHFKVSRDDLLCGKRGRRRRPLRTCIAAMKVGVGTLGVFV